QMIIYRLWRMKTPSEKCPNFVVQNNDYKTRLRDSIRNMVNTLDRHASATVEELNDNNGKNADVASPANKEQSEAEATQTESHTEA
ncbi:hypothetical protein AB7W42_16460, partial [Providencia rettgeri]